MSSIARRPSSALVGMRAHRQLFCHCYCSDPNRKPLDTGSHHQGWLPDFCWGDASLLVMLGLQLAIASCSNRHLQAT